MIVDDDADWISECAFMLDSLGYNPVTALSANEAIAKIGDDPVSLVIVDYNMPSCDGLALIHRLSAIAAEDGRQIRFIMATGHASMEIAVEAMRASAIDFLQKPVSREDLQKALQRISGLHGGGAARAGLLDKISTLSSELRNLTRLIDDKPQNQASPAGNALPASAKAMITADFIRGLLRNEAKRRSLAGGMLFGDPAWNILLDLLLAKLEKRTVSVSSACIASGAPTSTALRLINRLIEDDILYRIQDEQDGRRSFLGISTDIEQGLMDYLTEQAGQPALPLAQ